MLGNSAVPVKPTDACGTAVIVGASSGIGAALARALDRDGWRLALLARRIDRLEEVAAGCRPGTRVLRADVSDPEAAAATVAGVIAELGGIDLLIISAGAGHLNPELGFAPDRDTAAVNVLGFTAVAQAAMRHFLGRGRGHLVGITSVASLRPPGAGAAYAASKAFQSAYLDGLRDLVRQRGLPITVTEAQPGYVDTPMLKPSRPLPYIVRRFFVASADAAARQILRAIHGRARHVYVTRRWAIIAFLLRWMPRSY
jgi:short-subunit dehydrogenase